MLPHAIPHPPHLRIPKYISPNPKHSSPTFQLASFAVSPLHSDSPTDTVDDDQIPSPRSRPGSSGNYHYDSSAPRPLESHTEMYDSTCVYSATPHSFTSPSDQQQAYHINSAATPVKESGGVASYLSESPSPVDMSRSSPFPHPFSAPHSQERFPHSGPPSYPEADSLNHPESLQDRFPRQVLHSGGGHSHPSLLDQRRMSEPAILGSANLYAPQAANSLAGSRYEQFTFAFNPPPAAPSRSPSIYVPPLHRGSSIGSLRDLRNHQFDYSPAHAQTQHDGWKQDEDAQNPDRLNPYDSGCLDEPISPLQPNFSGGLINSPTSGAPYSPVGENFYGPSPPGTGTSTSSIPPSAVNFNYPSSQPPHMSQRGANIDETPADPTNSKTYSFVALPGNAVKKRPRRRYDEIERLYQCSWPDCSKAYGTLNHLNAHVTMQKHGPKRSPNEFKELRKQWRKAKKESETPLSGSMRRDSIGVRHDSHGLYNSHRYSPVHHSLPLHRQHSSHHLSGLPSSVSIPQPGSNERYSVGVDEIRYPVHDRDDHLVNYGHVSVRQRYNGVAPASWHPGSSLPSRTSIHDSYHSHHSQLAHHSLHSHQSHPHLRQSPPSPPRASLNRLPMDSTLFTPLPGYQPPSLLPPLQATNGDIGYAEGYDMYEEDSNGRPGTGHASIGPESGDEYEHRG